MPSIGMDDRTWQSDAPSNKTLSSSPFSGTQEAGRSVNNVSESIHAMEMSLIKTVDDLAAQRGFADSLLLEVSALKKKISATARYMLRLHICNYLAFACSSMFFARDCCMLRTVSLICRQNGTIYTFSKLDALC